jgi:hypothetical protein
MWRASVIGSVPVGLHLVPPFLVPLSNFSGVHMKKILGEFGDITAAGHVIAIFYA